MELEILGAAKAQLDAAWEEFLKTGVIFERTWKERKEGGELIPHTTVRAIVRKQASQLRLPVITASETKWHREPHIQVVAGKEKRIEPLIAPMLLIASDKYDAVVRIDHMATQWRLTFNGAEGIKIYKTWVSSLPAPTSIYMERAA